jgi:four helix bundle protein
MARDYRRLRVFQEAHDLVLAISRVFPKEEWFGIRAQIRRAAVSIPSNVVEGSARRGTREYFNFLNIARESRSAARVIASGDGVAAER